MANEIPEPGEERLKERMFVRYEDGSYRGWRRDLLTEKLEEVEERCLVCQVCSGLIRNACLYEGEIDQEVRCFVCIPEPMDIEKALLYQDSVNGKYVVCPLKEEGCEWSDVITQVFSHLNECDFFPVECPLGCVSEKEQIKRKFLDEHQKDYCPMRLINCESCDREMRACEMNEHLSICEEYFVLCPNSCLGRDIRKLKRKHLPSHLGEECPLQLVECPYAEYGCKERMERRLINQHEEASFRTHFKITNSIMTKQYSKILELERENVEKLKAISQLKRGQSEEIIQIKTSNAREITKLKNIMNLLISTVASSPVGKLEWEITGVDEKIRNKDTTYSDPFYVGYYKCQCELAWDHEEQGYIACFLHILKGKWDDVVRWPFRWKYTLVIYKQTVNGRNYVKSSEMNEGVLLYPRYFEKPTESGSNSFGWMDSISHRVIKKSKYINNDSMCFKIIIE